MFKIEKSRKANGNFLYDKYFAWIDDVDISDRLPL